MNKKFSIKRIITLVTTLAVIMCSLGLPQFSDRVEAAGYTPSNDFYIDSLSNLKNKKVFFGEGGKKWIVAGIENGNMILVNDPSDPILGDVKYKDPATDVAYKDSDLRAALDNAISDNSIFTAAQQDLMAVIDRNEVQAKLMTLDGTTINSIKAGNETPIDFTNSPFKDSTINQFWLVNSVSDNATTIAPGGSGAAPSLVDIPKDTAGIKAIPFIYVKTADFKFAARKDPSDQAYRLYFDAKDKIKSTIQMNDTKISIKYDSSDSALTLLSQVWGNNGSSDWMDEQTITESKSASGADNKFASAKAWLAASIDGVNYAKEYTALDPEAKEISSVEATISVPVGGKPFDKTVTGNTEGIDYGRSTVDYLVNDSGTYKIAKEFSDGGDAKYNKQYAAQLKIFYKDGYKFADNVTIKINDDKTTNLKVSSTSTAYRYAIYDFPSPTAKAKLKEIPSVSEITGITNGAEKSTSGLKLPSTVAIKTEDTSITKADVKWDVDKCSYDKAKTTAQSFEVEGTVTLPSTITNPDDISLKTKVKVTVDATKNAVATPTVSPAAGEYTSTQNITITTATSGATIYYTIDGSAPTTSSTKYTGPVAMEGKTGYAVTRTLKTIAVKDGMSNSAVGSYTYKVTVTSSSTTSGTAGTAGTLKSSDIDWGDDDWDDEDDEDDEDDDKSTSSQSSDDEDFDEDDLDWGDDEDDDDLDFDDDPWAEYLIGGYDILDGDGGVWKAGDDPLSIRGEGPLDKFLAVLIDGDEVDREDYTLTEGSTIVTFSSDYMEFLDSGDYFIDMIWEDGSASGSFSVENDDWDDWDDEESLFDEFLEDGFDAFYWEDLPIWAWILIILIPLIWIIAAAVVLILYYRKRKREKEGGPDDNSPEPPKSEKPKKEKAPKDPNKKKWFSSKKNAS